VQISLALPETEGCCRSRAIPVDFHRSERLKLLRDGLDNQGARERQLVVSVDGSYTNATVLKKLPERVTLIGQTSTPGKK